MGLSSVGGLRLPTAEEERAASLDLVRSHQQVGPSLLEARATEVALERLVDAILWVLRPIQVTDGTDSVEKAAREDVAALFLVESHQFAAA